MIFLLNTAFAQTSYPHFATWRKNPDVIICQTKTITKEFVTNSVAYWENLGYNFGEIKQTENCDIDPEGKILITEKTLDKKQGISKIELFTPKGSEKDYMASVILELNQEKILYPGENKHTLIHELGHAIGIGHVNNEKDVMYPYAVEKNISN